MRLRADLGFDITFATQFAILEPCVEAYLDRMQTNLVKHDTAELVRLYEFGPPFIRGPGYRWLGKAPWPVRLATI